MLIHEFGLLPGEMQTPAVKIYYDMLAEKRRSLIFKRAFDIVVSTLLIVLLSPVFLVIAVMIKTDSKGPVFYRQIRMTKNLKEFRIFKFRTMVSGADKSGPLVTLKKDGRITRVGGRLRRLRLDELPQIFNVFLGDMSFVGTRPEVKKYVLNYTDEMFATLLLPAGVTSTASIRYKDEAGLLTDAKDTDRVYLQEILPKKMVYNLEYLRDYRFFEDIKILFRTVFAVSK